MRYAEGQRHEQLKDIEDQVKQLTSEELRALLDWFAQYDADAWDRQIESDARSGKDPGRTGLARTGKSKELAKAEDVVRRYATLSANWLSDGGPISRRKLSSKAKVGALGHD